MSMGQKNFAIIATASRHLKTGVRNVITQVGF